MRKGERSRASQERLSKVTQWLAEGRPRPDAIRALQEDDGLSRRSAYRIVADAESRVAAEETTRTEHHRARLLADLRRYQQRMERVVDDSEALAAKSGRPGGYFAAIKAQLAAIKAADSQAELLHLRSVSPYLGLEEAEVRERLLEALERRPEALGPSQRARLRALLDELEAQSPPASTEEVPALPEAWK